MPSPELCVRCGRPEVIPTTHICRACLSTSAFQQLNVLWACLLPEQREAWLRRICVRRST